MEANLGHDILTRPAGTGLRGQLDATATEFLGPWMAPDGMSPRAAMPAVEGSRVA